jgi:hypothetical protein
MAVLHRALFTWFICLMFLILVVLRLDKRVKYVSRLLTANYDQCCGPGSKSGSARSKCF